MANNSNVLDPYSAQSYSQTLLVNISRIVFGLFAILGNGFILYTFARNPSVRKNLCNALIGVLAFSDFWTGLGFFVWSSVTLSFQLIPWYNYTTGECLILQYITISGVQMSQIATIFIAIDRLKAVQDPMNYSAQNRAQRFSFVFSVTLFYSLIATAFIFVGIEFDSFPSPTFCNAGSVLNQYYIIYWQVFAIVVAVTVIICYMSTSRIMTLKLSTTSSDRMNRELAKEKKIFKTITIVLVVYFLCWCLPNFVTIIATLMGADAETLGKLSPIVSVGSGISASANVLVYAWKHNELGAAMRGVFTPQNEMSSNRRSTMSA